MKGTVYSGIVHFPEHPDSDLHGLVRVVVREWSFIAVTEKLSRLYGLNITGAWNLGIWYVSRSHVEEQAANLHKGEFLACPLVLQYLKPENYKPIPKSLLRRKP